MCRICISRRGLLLAPALATRQATARESEAPVEPRLRLRATDQFTVALTLDCCPGSFDARLAAGLVESGIPATIFLTELWMRRNPPALAYLLAHPDIFGFGNHGARHLPPVLGTRAIYGIAPAGSIEAVRQEVTDGARAIATATGVTPRWYRGATGLYSQAALPEIAALGVAIAGYSLNSDAGASLPATGVATRIAAACNGDVIVAHINQPTRPSGAGVLAGVRALQQRGTRFRRLDQLKQEELDIS